VRPARKRSPTAALRESRKRFSRCPTVVFCSELFHKDAPPSSQSQKNYAQWTRLERNTIMNPEFFFPELNRRAKPRGFRHKFIVPEAHAGLLYRHGVFARTLNAGRHVLWGFGWSLTTTDLRRTSTLVARQEVLTTDNVALKLSLLITHQVADAVKAAHETQNWVSDLYNAA